MRAGQQASISVVMPLPSTELHCCRCETSLPRTGAQVALLPPQNAAGNFTKIVQRVPVRIHLDASVAVAAAAGAGPCR